MIKITGIYRSIKYLCFCLLFICCGKDKGNYDYQTINKLQIVDQDGNPLNEATYNLMLGEGYTIFPKITGSISTINISQLDFYWILGTDTVSRDQSWKITATTLGAGVYLCKLLVMDKETDLSYTSAFFVSVRAGIYKGSIILTANEHQEGILTMRSSDVEASYIYRSSFGNIRLGKHPVDIEVTYQELKDSTKSFQQVLMTTKAGAFPMFATDLVTLNPTLVFPAIGSVLSGELLNPSYYLQENDSQTNNERFDGILLINGKCYSLERGIISNDLYRVDPLDYDFGDHAVIYNGKYKGFELAGFDKRNERIRVFHNNGIGGAFTANRDADISPQLTKGHSFLAARSLLEFLYDRVEVINWQFLTRNDDKAQLLNISNSLFDIEAKVIASKSVPEMIDGVGFKFHDGYWYFGKGRTIYRFAATGLNIEPYLTLSADQSGDITAWNFYKNPASQVQKMGIATYDANSSKTHKGSYYLYDIQGKKYELQDRNVIDKAVDIELCY